MMAMCLWASMITGLILAHASKARKEYVTIFTQNFVNQNKNVYLYIASGNTKPVSVSVMVPYLNDTHTYTNLTLNPGQREKITLPYTVRMPYGTLTSNRIVTVISDDEVTVIASNIEASNMDMYYVSESGLLGKEYVVALPGAFSTVSAGTVGIVSPYTDAKVKVTLPESIPSLEAVIDGVTQTLDNEFTIALNESQVFQIQSKTDLSGTHIQSDLPLAVVSGVNRTSDIGGNCADGQISQLLSVDKLGTRHIVFGLKETEVQDIVHVVSTEANTNVTFQGETSTIVEPRGILRYMIDRNLFSLLETSSPAVVAMSTTSGKSPTIQGDVSFYSIQSLPLRGYRYVITVPEIMPIVYLILMVESDSVDHILLDDVPITDADWQSVNGTNISACYYPVTDNGLTRTLRHSKGKPFALYLQGFKYCQGYSLLFPATDVDLHLPLSCDNTGARHLQVHPGIRMTSTRLQLLMVEERSHCFLHCVKYEECIGVNFSTQVNSWEVNCQLVFTQTDGQENSPDWTYYGSLHD